MSQNVGWRNFWWLNTALLGLTVVCCTFLFPETKYNRVLVANARTESSSPPLKVATVNEFEDQPAQNGTQTATADHADLENKASVQSQNPLSSPNDATLSHAPTHQDPYLGRGKPSKAQWKIMQPYHGNLLLELWMPWYLCIFPIVEFAAFIVSWSASGFLTLNLTQSQAFAAPPYNFTASKIGFFNFAILVGALIGLFTAGPLSDFIAARLTKRNRGIREPEMRLWAMVPYVAVMLVGNVIVAVGYDRSWDWKVKLVSIARKLPLSHVLIPEAGHCDNRLHLRRHPGRRAAGNRIHLRDRLVQAGFGLHLCGNYGK